MLAKLFNFNGGVHPPEHKLESTQRPIQTVVMPKTLVLPLRQHVGKLAKLSVAVGDHVLKGQLLATADGMISAAVHAPTSGTIVSIDDQLIPHVSGLPDQCITLEADGQDTWGVRQSFDYLTVSKDELIERLRQGGVVGLGGAVFPSHVKLRADARRPVKTLVINGAECEPYITCDDMLMRERAEEIVRGVEIMQYLLNAERSLIGVEDNKPEAIAAMREACAKRNAISVVVVPTRYPSGGAKQLIKLLTGLEVPKGKLSPELGVQCFNVATAYTIARFIHHGEPVIARIVTLTGAVNNPGNFEVPLGMLMDDLLEAAGGTQDDCNGLIMGGPMMGFNLPSNHVPVVKATNCIIASASAMFPPKPAAMPCIRCARCADACPASLQPQELYWFSKSSNFEKARDYSLFDCIECGCCDYVCPSNIPLVDYYRFAKSEIIAADKAKEAANLARERNEFRLARIEREKAERAEKHAKKAAGANAGVTAAPDAADDAKKAAIAAAIARAQAQKAEVTPQNTEVSEKKQAEIAEIDARRAQVNEPLASDTDVKQE